MNALPTAIRAVRWMVRDTFRQSLASKLFWVVLGITALCTVFCLGMRVETVDMTEFVRRIDREIYDREEYLAAIRWVREKCQEGKDWNQADKQRSREQKDQDWKTSVKMAIIARDLMIGLPALGTWQIAEGGRLWRRRISFSDRSGPR